MDTNKNQPDVKPLIDNLNSKFDIEEIYLNTFTRESLPYELVILVADKYLKSLNDLVPMVTYALREYLQYHVLCYVAFQVKSNIALGSIFLLSSCQPHKLIYKKKNSQFSPFPKKLDLEKFKETAFTLQKRKQKKIEEFKNAYYYFKEKEQLGLASFMLHQAMELSYRYLELMIVAKKPRRHSIVSHHRYLKKISSACSQVFDENDHKDAYLLRVLEGIYSGARYENDFHIKVETLLLLELKMEFLIKKTIEVIDHFNSSFKQQHIDLQTPNLPDHCVINNSKNMKLKNDTLIKAVEHIKQSIAETITVYVFGHRKQSFIIEGINDKEIPEIHKNYYNLLVVSNTDIREQVTSLQPMIGDHYEVSLLLAFTKDQIQEFLDKNNPFFHQILQKNGSLLYDGLESHDWHFHKENGIRTEKEMGEVEMSWYDRENNASGFYNGGEAIDHSEEAAIKVLLFNRAMEQACLGLLEYFYGYTAYQQNLDHLYNLCSNLWHFPNDIFPRFTKEDKKVYDEFVHVPTKVLVEGSSDLDWDEAYRYEERCKHFLDECSKVVRGTFNNN